jgi:hypothetical protein
LGHTVVNAPGLSGSFFDQLVHEGLRSSPVLIGVNMLLQRTVGSTKRTSPTLMMNVGWIVQNECNFEEAIDANGRTPRLLRNDRK